MAGYGCQTWADYHIPTQWNGAAYHTCTCVIFLVWIVLFSSITHSVVCIFCHATCTLSCRLSLIAHGEIMADHAYLYYTIKSR